MLQVQQIQHRLRVNPNNYKSQAHMKIPRPKRVSPEVRLPNIRDGAVLSNKQMSYNNPILAGNKNLKLEKINRNRNIALVDVAKITDNIQKQFNIKTKRGNINQMAKQGSNNKKGNSSSNKDEMRESRLLLLKDITPQAPKKSSNNQNLLSSLVEYSKKPSSKNRPITIPQNHISSSPSKQKQNNVPFSKFQVQSLLTIYQIKKKESAFQSQYANPQLVEQIDFVKQFIVQELLYYISHLKEKVKEQMSGFCKFYNQNSDPNAIDLISQVLVRKDDYLESVFYEKIGFYIFLILGTDIELEQQASFLLHSLTQYIHKNNLIFLDTLMEIVDIEKLSFSSQFHVYNTSRFNEDRRKIIHNEDRMSLVAKNNQSLKQIIKSILMSCGFDSLKSFVFEIIANEDVDMFDKIAQVSTMLVSLDGILSHSSMYQMQEKDKPKPPFLAEMDPKSGKKYTLVLDMDQTLIHYREIQGEDNNSFLIRPYCQQFLTQMFKYYQIVVFTAAVKQYADSILDSIDPQGRITSRLYRQHTRLEDYVSIKDLSYINRSLDKSIIVDNIASNFKMQPRNGIAISTWTGEEDDIALSNLIPVLRKLVVDEVNDVRDGLEKLSEYMEAQMIIQEEENINSKVRDSESDFQAVDFEGISLKGL